MGAIAAIATAVVEATAKADNVEDQARVGLRAAWTVMTEDRRKARVIASVAAPGGRD
jgi:hypothetical protein